MFKHIGNILYSIRYKKYLKNLNKNNEISMESDISMDCIFEGKNRVLKNVILRKVKIGYASYIGSGSFFGNTDIGRYCSIGDNVRLVAGRHPTKKFVSTHPAFYSLEAQKMFGYVHKQIFDEYHFADSEGSKWCTIGNDVWIGNSAMILDGVNIGDGAIVGAGSLVNNNIPPYAIVGGVPAKIIRYRFSEDERRELLKLKWWNKDPNSIKENAKYFDDITTFLKRYCDRI